MSVRGPLDFHSIYEAIDHFGTHTPDAIFMLALDRAPMTYGALRDQTRRTREALGAAGIGRGDRVAVVLPNGPEMTAAYLAIVSATTFSPLNPDYPERQFEFYLRDLRPDAMVVLDGLRTAARAVADQLGIPVIELVPLPGEVAGRFELRAPMAGEAAEPGPAEPDDVATVVHTSGTTSRPKIVPHTHRAMALSCTSARDWLGLDVTDRLLAVMPMHHLHGLLIGTLGALMSGGSLVATPGFYAPEFLGWIERFAPTWLTAVPTMFQAVLERAPAHRDVIERARLRFIRTSSAAMPVEVFHRLEETFGVPVIEVYGSSESCQNVTSNPMPPGVRKPGSVGIPITAEVAIADAAGNFLPPGTRGEIVVRGAIVFGGYEDNPQANAESFFDGWLRTGDEGYMDDDGYFYVSGRLKETIIRGGENVAPREVDEVLLTHPQVRQALTFALPDERLGEDVAAAVVLREGANVTALELREYVADHLAAFKVPREVVFVDDIPKTSTGKPRRVGAAQALGLAARPQASAPSSYVAPRNELEAALAEIWAEVLKVPQVGVNDRFLDLGGDSVLAGQIVARVRGAIEADFSVLQFLYEPTVAGQARMLEALTEDGSQNDG